MFGSVGGMEIILVLVLALLLFGPRKLPQIGRTVGKALSEFRRATTDFKMNLEREVELSEVRSAQREITQAVDEVKNVGVARGPNRAEESAKPAVSGAGPAAAAPEKSSTRPASAAPTPDAETERDD